MKLSVSTTFFFVLLLGLSVVLYLLLSSNTTEYSEHTKIDNSLKVDAATKMGSSYLEVEQQDFFNAFVEKPGFKMVMVGASWCAPCVAFKNTLKKANFTDFPIIYVDGETPQFRGYAARLGIVSYPQSVFYDGSSILPVNIHAAPKIGRTLPGIFTAEELKFIQKELAEGFLPDLPAFRNLNGSPQVKEKEIWRNKLAKGWVNTVKYDSGSGFVFASTRNGYLLALDGKTGQVVIEKKIGKTSVSDLVVFRKEKVLYVSVYKQEGSVTTYAISENPVKAVLVSQYDFKEFAGTGQLDFDPNSGFLAVSRDLKKTVVILDPLKMTMLALLEGAQSGNRGIDFSKDGRLLAFGGKNSGVYVFETQNWQRKLLLRGHENWVRTVSFDSSGDYLYSAGRDYSSRVWDLSAEGKSSVLPVESRRCFKSFDTEHKNPRVVISGSYDGSVRMFDRATNTLIKEISYDLSQREGVADMDYASEIDMIFTGHVNGDIRGTRLGNISLIRVPLDKLDAESVDRSIRQRFSNRSRKHIELTVGVFPRDLPKYQDIEIGTSNMRFVLVPGGFMSITESRRDLKKELPPFYIAESELTVGQALALGAKESSFFETDPDTAAHNLRAESITKMLAQMSEMTDREVRVPTEIEWEYAARAGSKMDFPDGDSNNVEMYGHLNSNSDLTPGEVRQLKPNPWGLYDMLGNVREVALFGDDAVSSPGMYVVKGPGYITSKNNAGFASGRYYSLGRKSSQPFDVDPWIGVRFILSYEPKNQTSD